MTARHVLVAEDEPHIARLIAIKLETGPFRVTTVGDGEAALAALAAHDDIALVILDLMMPGVGGLEVLRQVRATPATRSLPCIVLTATGQDAAHRQARDLGANEFLTKPFSPKKLLATALALVGAEARPGG
ncbi:MAG: response regulator [Gemmatimonadetes bacterium]|nr:response regulator [Gemmatimonadota bacterium]